MHIHALENVNLQPFARWGLVNSFWTINVDTVVYTWVSMVCLFIFVAYSNRALQHPRGAVQFLVDRVVAFFDSTLQDGFGTQNIDSTGFIVGIFFFTLFCNVCGMLPFIKEATVNINTTLAIAILCFSYVQYQSIVARKWGFLLKFLKPFFLLAPLNIVGQVAKIASLNFRLFGNILGGAIIWDLLYQQLAKIHTYFAIAGIFILPICLLIANQKLFSRLKFLQSIAGVIIRLIQAVPAALIIFGIFEGVLHAFVISLLTSIYVNNEVDTNSVH